LIAFNGIVLAQLLVAVWPFSSPPPPTPPPVQTPGSNVTITTCFAQVQPPLLRIGYVNTAKAAAVEIDFDVESNAGPITTVTDRGTFESNAPIVHVFPLPSDVSPLGLSSARCVVTKVAYADGKTWTKAEASLRSPAPKHERLAVEKGADALRRAVLHDDDHRVAGANGRVSGGDL
jgi:hypothetical protein